MGKSISVPTFLHLALLVVISQTQASGTDRLSNDRHVDTNGFFEIYPPASWRIQEYPDDPRGKVAFIGPDGVELRILAKGIDYGFEHMVKEMEAQQAKLGVITNISRIDFGGRQAIQRTFTYNGLKLLFIDILVGNTTHNLMYSAQSEKYEQHLQIAQLSMSTYEPKSTRVSEEDIVTHSIAKSIRLSRIFFEQGDYDLSLYFIDEGLSMDSDNSVLTELKNEILRLEAYDPNTIHPDTNAPAAKELEHSDTTSAMANGVEGSPKDDGEPMSPAFFLVISLVGATILVFQTGLAQGTSAPGIAKITTPLVGLGLLLAGLVNLFENDHVTLGILTILLIVVVLFSPYWVPRVIKRIKDRE